MSILVSIVLPVYNGEDYLEEAINSILKQDYSTFELIVVNDASTDGTIKILDSFDDPRITVLQNRKNLKLPKSLNSGFEIANGDIHTWTSHDNILERDFLSTMINALSMSDADFVYSNYQVINEDGNYLRTAKVEPSELLVTGNCIGASFAYKSEIFTELGGYSEDKFMFEDYDFWVRCCKKGYKMLVIEGSPYQYRIHKDQLSNSIKLPKNYIRYRLDYVVNSPLIRKNIRILAFANLVSISFRNRNFFITSVSLLHMLALNPFETYRVFITKVIKRFRSCK